MHTAGPPVAAKRQRRAVALLPDLQQGVRKQREGARLGGNVGKDRVRQPVFECQPDAAGRLLDR
jgi:hypothetical protein